jgi:dipeptidyl aminopeptidase/acylaminoacyl peptidase
MQPLAWSPDGRSILVNADTSGDLSAHRLGLVSVSDGSFRALAERNPTLALFSPDGRHIVYDHASTRGVPMHDINIIDVDGTNDRPLVSGPDHDYLLGWFRDGRHLLFGSDRLNAPGAWALPIANGMAQGEPLLVRADIGRTASLGFDLNGRFYSTLSVAGMDVFLAEIDPASGTVTSPSRPAPKADSLSRRNQATWSPDGRRLAYTQVREGRGVNLVVQTVATGELAVHPLPLTNVERPSWFPDGRSLALEATDHDRVRGIYRVELASGQVSALLRPGQNFSFVARDGRFLFYAARQTLWRRRFADGQEDALLKGRVAGVVESPDGRFIARWLGGPKGASLGVVPAGGGAERIVLEGIPASHNELAWSHDGRHLFFIAHRNQLWRAPVSGGSGTDTGIRIEIAKHISVHPDGRQIALSGGAAQAEVWMWENLLPRR